MDQQHRLLFLAGRWYDETEEEGWRRWAYSLTEEISLLTDRTTELYRPQQLLGALPPTPGSPPPKHPHWTLDFQLLKEGFRADQCVKPETIPRPSAYYWEWWSGTNPHHPRSIYPRGGGDHLISLLRGIIRSYTTHAPTPRLQPPNLQLL